MQFLNGLNEIFGPTIEQILLIDPMPFLNKVHAMVLAQERQKGLSLPMINTVEAALLTILFLEHNLLVKQAFLREIN